MNERIALIRRDKKCKQDDFAESLGLTKNFISLVETGKREPSDRTIKDICRVYSVNENWLRTGEGDMYLPEDRETEIAKFTVDLLTEESDSFKNRLISALAKLTEEQWELLAHIADEITKKE